jgi:hypothetical protein
MTSKDTTTLLANLASNNYYVAWAAAHELIRRGEWRPGMERGTFISRPDQPSIGIEGWDLCCRASVRR